MKYLKLLGLLLLSITLNAQYLSVDKTTRERVFSETIPQGNVNITSVISVHNTDGADYVYKRKIIRAIADSSFNSLNDKEKDIVGIYCADTINVLIDYYMSKGMSQPDATNYYILRRSEDIINSGEAYHARLTQARIIALIMTYLGESQGLTFLDAIRNFKEDLKTIALLGTNYGNDRDGVMDYIESTGSYSDGGLKSYNIEPAVLGMFGGDEELARQYLVNELHNLIYVYSIDYEE